MTTPAGVFGGEVAAFEANVDFSDASALTGNAGLKFGDLTLCNVVPAGLDAALRSRWFSYAANTALGAGAIPPAPRSLDLNTLAADNLNFASEAGSVGVWAQDHLVNGPCP